MSDDTVRTQVFMLEVMVIALDDEVSKEDMITLIEENHYLHVRVMEVEERMVKWNDDHPLNFKDKMKKAFAKLFK